MTASVLFLSSFCAIGLLVGCFFPVSACLYMDSWDGGDYSLPLLLLMAMMTMCVLFCC